MTNALATLPNPPHLPAMSFPVSRRGDAHRTTAKMTAERIHPQLMKLFSPDRNALDCSSRMQEFGRYTKYDESCESDRRRVRKLSQLQLGELVEQAARPPMRVGAALERRFASLCHPFLCSAPPSIFRASQSVDRCVPPLCLLLDARWIRSGGR